LVAMTVEQCGPLEPWRREAGRALHKEFGESERLLAQSAGFLAGGKEFVQLVAKYRDATRLKTYNRRASADVRGERVENLPKQALCRREHPEIIEGPSAAEHGQWKRDLKAGGFEHFDSSDGRLGRKEIVEGIGPKNQSRALLPHRRTAREPFTK